MPVPVLHLDWPAPATHDLQLLPPSPVLHLNWPAQTEEKPEVLDSAVAAPNPRRPDPAAVAAMPFTPGPYSGKSTLALVARASAVGVGVVYGAVKLEQAKSKFSVPVSAPRDFAMATAEDGVGDLLIYDLDPKFAGFKDHFSYRMKMYLEQKHLIEKYEGGLEEFSKGYLKFGINTENDATVYREWVPCLFFSSGWTQQVLSLHGRGGHRSGTR